MVKIVAGLLGFALAVSVSAQGSLRGLALYLFHTWTPHQVLDPVT